MFTVCFSCIFLNSAGCNWYVLLIGSSLTLIMMSLSLFITFNSSESEKVSEYCSWIVDWIFDSLIGVSKLSYNTNLTNFFKLVLKVWACPELRIIANLKILFETIRHPQINYVLLIIPSFFIFFNSFLKTLYETGRLSILLSISYDKHRIK